LELESEFPFLKEPNLKPGSSFYLVVEQEPEQRFWEKKMKTKIIESNTRIKLT
jgi:hypothetical protein